jgi:hypothetical protein
MNTKLFLTTAALVAFLVSIFSAVGLDRSSTATAQAQVSAPHSTLVANEPVVRLWSGAVQFNDADVPDFRPHAETSAKPRVVTECMSDEGIKPRRWGGCIQ